MLNFVSIPHAVLLEQNKSSISHSYFFCVTGVDHAKIRPHHTADVSTTGQQSRRNTPRPSTRASQPSPRIDRPQPPATHTRHNSSSRAASPKPDKPHAHLAMARHLAPPGSFHRLLASRHYPPSSPAPPPRPLLLLPKTLIPPAAAAMEFPRRGRRDVAAASAPASSSPETEVAPGAWGKVSAVLFDMDGVLCNSEELSRLAGVDLFAEMGVDVTGDDFVPYMGTGKLSRRSTTYWYWELTM